LQAVIDPARIARTPYPKAGASMASSPVSKGAVLLQPRVLRVPRLWRRHSERRALIVGCALVVIATAIAVPAYTPMHDLYSYVLGRSRAPAYALLGGVPGPILATAGVLALWSHPSSRIGPLLIAEGLAWDIGPFITEYTAIPADPELTFVTQYLSYAIGGHILLSYPSGRLRARSDRVLVSLLYVGFGPLIIMCALFHADFGPGCPTTPANAFLITPNDTLDIAMNSAYFVITGGLMALAGLRSVPRWVAATPVARRSLAPVYVTRWFLAGSIAVWCATGAAVVFGNTTKANLYMQVPVNLAAMASAGGILVVFMRKATAGGAAGRLALDLDGAPLAAGRLEQAVRSALGDEDARLLFRAPDGASWVDSAGQKVTAAEGRSITTFDGMSGSALEHDAAFNNDPAVVEAVGAVAGLALEAERLRVMLRANGRNGNGRARTDGSAAMRSLLTPREYEVLQLVAEGLTDGAIAQRLYLTRRTVETHLGHIFLKLGVPGGSSHNRRVHAVRRFLEAAELRPGD
jgi:DNA-binding CsgD family transcriptional regulator